MNKRQVVWELSLHDQEKGQLRKMMTVINLAIWFSGDGLYKVISRH